MYNQWIGTKVGLMIIRNTIRYDMIDNDDDGECDAWLSDKDDDGVNGGSMGGKIMSWGFQITTGRVCVMGSEWCHSDIA